MAAESTSRELNLGGSDLRDRPFLPPSVRLKDALGACSKSFESGDLGKSDEAVAAVVVLLNSIVDPPQSDTGDVVIDDSAAENALEEMHRYLSSPSSNQMVTEALSLELPKVMVKFVALSNRCQEVAESIIDCLIATCSPRDMLLILCEALDSQIRVSKSPSCFIPFLGGISKVFLHIQRRHLEQVKVALPIVLSVLHASSSESDEEDIDNLRGLFGAAVSIGTSIQAICGKMQVGGTKNELHAILGLYVLQNIALISRSKHADIISSYSSLVLQFSEFLPFCGFSYLGLMTGSDVTSVIDEVSKEDDGDFLTCFSYAANGAALSVIWGHINNDVAQAAGEQLTPVLNKIQSNQSVRWQAIGMLKPILSSIYYSWELKTHSIDLLASMVDRSNAEEQNDNHMDFSSFMPSLFTALQAIQRIMIGASDASLRKKAFATLRKIIADIPSSQRFDMLKALITNSNSPSMIAILIDLVREEIVAEGNKRTSSENGEDIEVERRKRPFWSSHALDLVGLILKPPKGGPPSLPEDSDPVLSALNLLRFILIMESTGKTNHTGVLSESTLQKVYTEWLLPLRTLVSGICAENETDESELADHILCGLNPVQLVLYRCIELVENNLKHSK